MNGVFQLNRKDCPCAGLGRIEAPAPVRTFSWPVEKFDEAVPSPDGSHIAWTADQYLHVRRLDQAEQHGSEFVACAHPVAEGALAPHRERLVLIAPCTECFKAPLRGAFFCGFLLYLLKSLLKIGLLF